MNIILGKDFNVELGHMPRKGYIPNKDHFKKATSISPGEQKLIDKYKRCD